MATVSVPRTRPLVGSFYVGMAGLCAAIAFGGFLMTYWVQLAWGTFVGTPMVHLHGLLFSAWTLLFLSQAILMANGRVLPHKASGLAGISLATAMLFTGLAVAIGSLEHRIEAGYVEAGRAFAIVPITAVVMFFSFVVAAIANIRRPEWHKRFMLVATVSLLNAAVARFFFLWATGGGGPGMRPGMGPPRPVEFATMPGLVADLIVLAAILHDWRKRGRPHPAYLWGLGLLVLVQFGRIPVSRTAAWHNFADFLSRFAG